jgi:LAGLIDADG-like domain
MLETPPSLNDESGSYLLGNNISVWDNQQVTSSWFTGILEGEGNFRKQHNKYPEIRIVNTDLDIIKGCQKYLDNNHIMYNFSNRDRINRKKLYTISIINNSYGKYPQILFKLLNLECRHNEYQKILDTSETTCALTIDFDWLIGIFEAEGGFSLTLDHRNYAQLEINLINKRKEIINKVALNLKALYCAYNIRSFKSYRVVRICGMKRCKRFLYATKNKWISSRNIKRSSLMYEFSESRLEMPQREPYTSRQLQIIQTMRDLNS